MGVSLQFRVYTWGQSDTTSSVKNIMSAPLFSHVDIFCKLLFLNDFYKFGEVFGSTGKLPPLKHQ